jgi:hypothetical protein
VPCEGSVHKITHMGNHNQWVITSQSSNSALAVEAEVSFALGQALYDHRIDRGLAVEDVAEMCDMASMEVEQAERGEALVSGYLLARLCKGLGARMHMTATRGSVSVALIQL